MFRPPWPLPVIAKNAGVVDFGGITPDASAIGLRVDPSSSADGEVLRLVIDRAVRGILQLNAKDERILLRSATHHGPTT